MCKICASINNNDIVEATFSNDDIKIIRTMHVSHKLIDEFLNRTKKKHYLSGKSWIMISGSNTVRTIQNREEHHTPQPTPHINFWSFKKIRVLKRNATKEDWDIYCAAVRIL
jgi:hypothetical protein